MFACLHCVQTLSKETEPGATDPRPRYPHTVAFRLEVFGHALLVEVLSRLCTYIDQYNISTCYRVRVAVFQELSIMPTSCHYQCHQQ